MPKVLQFGIVTFKNMNKTRTNKRLRWLSYWSNVFKTKLNKPTTWVKYPTLLYVKNQTPNNIVYKGQVFKLDQHQCNSYNYYFPTNSPKLLASMGSSE